MALVLVTGSGYTTCFKTCLVFCVMFLGKTLLAKAVANQTSATFLRVVGSELIQKYLVSATLHYINILTTLN